MQSISRRGFLKTSSLLGASALFPVRSWAGVRGANDDVRIAVVGFHGQGKSHIEEFRKLKGVRVVGLCDADRAVLDSQAKTFRDRGQSIVAETDVRRLLEREDLDAISIATPNHTHSLISIWACQAGKDVYVEKPVSHNVWEGRKLVEAARKYKRIVQTGTQCRSSSGLREAVEWVQSGQLGKIKLARALCYKRRASIGKTDGPQSIPATVDYDLWCGPAPIGPLRRSRLHYDWHWVWDTGNGDLGNQGIHQMDIARWFLNEKELSPTVFSVGGRLGYQDDGETPNTLFVIHGYRPAPLIFEVRGLPTRAGESKMDQYRDASIGVVVECEHGFLINPSYTTAVARDRSGKEIRRFSGAIDHHANFIQAVRSRRVRDLRAGILDGHLSSALCHTGHISVQLGQKASPDEIRGYVHHDTASIETFERMQQHLAANGVDLRRDPLTLGVALRMDTGREKFKDNAAANRLLSRTYRDPYVVPERV